VKRISVSKRLLSKSTREGEAENVRVSSVGSGRGTRMSCLNSKAGDIEEGERSQDTRNPKPQKPKKKRKPHLRSRRTGYWLGKARSEEAHR